MKSSAKYPHSCQMWVDSLIEFSTAAHGLPRPRLIRLASAVELPEHVLELELRPALLPLCEDCGTQELPGDSVPHQLVEVFQDPSRLAHAHVNPLPVKQLRDSMTLANPSGLSSVSCFLKTW